jgi:hypothetical protein
MIKLTTALLLLGVMTATATTAIAGCNTCNPNAPRCRQICPPSRHHRHHATRIQTQFAIALMPTAAASQVTRPIVNRPHTARSARETP